LQITGPFPAESRLNEPCCEYQLLKCSIRLKGQKGGISILGHTEHDTEAVTCSILIVSYDSVSDSNNFSSERREL